MAAPYNLAWAASVNIRVTAFNLIGSSPTAFGSGAYILS